MTKSGRLGKEALIGLEMELRVGHTTKGGRGDGLQGCPRKIPGAKWQLGGSWQVCALAK